MMIKIKAYELTDNERDELVKTEFVHPTYSCEFRIPTKNEFKITRKGVVCKVHVARVAADFMLYDYFKGGRKMKITINRLLCPDEPSAKQLIRQVVRDTTDYNIKGIHAYSDVIDITLRIKDRKKIDNISMELKLRGAEIGKVVNVDA